MPHYICFVAAAFFVSPSYWEEASYMMVPLLSCSSSFPKGHWQFLVYLFHRSCAVWSPGWCTELKEVYLKYLFRNYSCPPNDKLLSLSWSSTVPLSIECSYKSYIPDTQLSNLPLSELNRDLLFSVQGKEIRWEMYLKSSKARKESGKLQFFLYLFYLFFYLPYPST